jgi:ubiquinone/menaquinone biosynthesis C-methylase UbiE
VNRCFEKAVAEWSEIYARHGVNAFVHQERLRIVLDMVGRIGLPAQSRALDVGCGTGVISLELAKMGYIVDAIDPVRAMVDATKARAKHGGQAHRVRAGFGDVHSLCFPNETFDLVLAIGVLPWLAAIGQPLREMGRVLRPGGCLIITVDNRWGLQRFLEPLTNPLLRPARELARRALRRRPKARPHMISLRRCNALLEAGGFERVESLTLGFGPFSIFAREILPPSLGLKLHGRLQAAADRGLPLLRAGGSQYIVRTEKCGTEISKCNSMANATQRQGACCEGALIDRRRVCHAHYRPRQSISGRPQGHWIRR